jgi:fatty-acyl-CoA synthase
MPIRLSERATGAYVYPLLIKHLLHRPLATAPEQEIVYKDLNRYTYRVFNERLARLANALKSVGVEAGTTVAVLDWDSHRYLECFFAIPMMGAVLQTVNVRLSHEQILYTLQHARAEVVLVHRDFLPLVEELKGRLGVVRAYILLEDSPSTDACPDWIHDEYENALRGSAPKFSFADFDENAVATTFYTTGTTGNPKGVCFSHRQIVLHTLAAMGALVRAFGTVMSTCQ